MKKINFFLTIIGILTLVSCNSEINCPENPLALTNQVKFNSTIGERTETRASGTTWDQGDAIGIYALIANQALSDQSIYDGKANIKHTTPGDGVFTAATTAITFPETGNLDFVAYYPYQQTINNYTYQVNVSNQSNPAAIDVLYSNNAKGIGKTTSPVGLVFKHMLSQLILNVSAGEGITSLTGLSASVSNMKVDGTMNLVNGATTLGSTVAAIQPVVKVSGTTATVIAIVVPGQDFSSAKVSFTLNGKVYEWTPETQALENGKKYSYQLKLSTTSGVVTVQPKATIIDWSEGYTGTSDIILTPNQDPQFVADKTSVSFPASGTLTSVVKLTTQADQAWTAVSSESWLTVNPTNGTGSQDITLTAQQNTATTERTATVTLTATGGTTSFSPIVITVTQEAGTATPPAPTAALLFPGSDFENWSAFLGSLSTHGLKNAVESSNGRNGTKALYINTTPAGNDYIFTATVQDGYSVAGKSKIVFYIKGTAGKSLSINVSKANGTNYHVFNLGAYSQAATLTPANENTQGNGTNSYTGAINTGGDWMKVTLDLSSITSDLSSTTGQNLFSVKVGKDVAYDLLIDDITLE